MLYRLDRRLACALPQVSVLDSTASAGGKSSATSINIDPYVMTTRAWRYDAVSKEVLGQG